MIIYTKIEQVERFLDLPQNVLHTAQKVESYYSFRCTDYFLELALENPNGEKILKQVLPSLEELEDNGEWDPFGEDGSTEHPYLIRRYTNRLLVLSTNKCFVHCRFCMRKRKWKEAPFVFQDFGFLERYLKAYPEIEDVLISGGDPFTLPKDWLKSILSLLRRIDTVRIVRIGTRAVGVAPEIIVEKAEVLKDFSPVWINAHFNHPVELTSEVATAVKALLKAGCPVNSQSVLLKGINDDYDTLRELFTGLLSVGIKPYYLFSCDPVRGVRHFSVPLEKGIELMKRLKEEASGMAIPHFAVDGRDGKKIVA
ncbi:KamA family radical SAM protein [Thermosulfidibacter takaii]|nr:KamA family radical SAM protein [Thermosulfidibacter takaii]